MRACALVLKMFIPTPYSYTQTDNLQAPKRTKLTMLKCYVPFRHITRLYCMVFSSLVAMRIKVQVGNFVSSCYHLNAYKFRLQNHRCDFLLTRVQQYLLDIHLQLMIDIRRICDYL